MFRGRIEAFRNFKMLGSYRFMCLHFATCRNQSRDENSLDEVLTTVETHFCVYESSVLIRSVSDDWQFIKQSV